MCIYTNVSSFIYNHQRNVQLHFSDVFDKYCYILANMLKNLTVGIRKPSLRITLSVSKNRLKIVYREQTERQKNFVS